MHRFHLRVFICKMHYNMTFIILVLVKLETHGQVYTLRDPLCLRRLCRQRLCEELNDFSHCRHGCFFNI